MMSRALSAFTDGSVAVLLPAELSLLTAEASSRELELTRCAALSELVTGRFGAAVITAGALMSKLPDPAGFASRILELEVGMTSDPDDMIVKLTEMGYEKVPQVMQRGEFARRGDIIDIFPADMTEPVRISFFDDEVDQLKNFDLETQRSTEQLSKVRIIPVRVYPAGSEEERKEAAEKIRIQAEEDISRMNKDSREARRAAELLTRTAEADAQKITVRAAAYYTAAAGKCPQTACERFPIQEASGIHTKAGPKSTRPAAKNPFTNAPPGDILNKVWSLESEEWSYGAPAAQL
jgi:transcription-repair coupling factor (superfamily II helicase)